MSKPVKIITHTTALLFLLALAFLAPVVANASTVNLSWTPPTTNMDGSAITNLVGYKVYYGTTSGQYAQNVDVGNVTSYQLANLTDGTTYYFAITAYNSSGGESAYSQEVSKAIQSVDTTPPVISGVYANNVTSSSASVSWVTDEASDSLVEYGTTAYYGYTNPPDSNLVTAHSQIIGGLAPSTTYHYRVTSRDASGNSASSADYSFTTAAAIDSTPPVISNVVVSQITSNSAHVAWNTDEPATTQVEYGTSSYTSSSATDYNLTTVHAVDISGLSSYTIYNVRVKSTDGVGNTATSAGQTFTTSNNAPTVTSFSASTSSGYAPLAVDFVAAGSDADGYITSYEWDFNGDGVYDKNTGTVGSASYTYSNAGTYNAIVRVTDNGGAVAVSDPITINVSTSVNMPPVVSSFTTQKVHGTDGMTIEFDAVASDPDGVITKYDWDFDGNGTIDATTATSPATYTFTTEGKYTPTVTVTDNYGATASAQTNVAVRMRWSGGGGGRHSSTKTLAGTGSGSSTGACFIASAAYGSYLQPQVQVLRDFRDTVLLTNVPGRAFVRFYYSVSPPIADYISRHPAARFATRVMLTPLVYGVKYPRTTLALFLIFAAALTLYVRRKGDRKHI